MFLFEWLSKRVLFFSISSLLSVWLSHSVLCSLAHLFHILNCLIFHHCRYICYKCAAFFSLLFFFFIYIVHCVWIWFVFLCNLVAMPRALSFFYFRKILCGAQESFCRCIHLLWIGWLTVFICLLMIVMMNIWPFLVHWEVVECSAFFSLISLFFVIHLFLSFGFAHVSLSRGLVRVLILIHSLLIHNIIRAFSGTRQQIRYYYCHLVYFPFAYCPVCRGRYIVGWLFMAIFIPKESHSCWLVWARAHTG